MSLPALKTNLMINMLGALVPLAVSIVATPIYVRHIGDARYGLLSIVWVLMGYLGFLDFGLSRAAVNALARLRSAPQSDRATVLVTTFGLNLGLGLMGSIVLSIGGGYLLQHVLNVPNALKPEIASAFPWIVGLFPLALVAGVGIGALESRERFLLANVLQVGGAAAGQIVPVVLAAIVSPSLALIIPAAALMRGLTVLAILLVVCRSEGPLSVWHFDRGQAAKLLSYGGWVTVTGVISPILVSADQFVIGTVLGVASLAYYAVPMSLVTRSQVLPSALARTLFPRMSQASGEDARRLAVRSWLSLAFGYGAVCAPAIILTPLFFRYWISPDFAKLASPVGQILFFGAWINGLAFIPYEMLQAQGRPDVTGKFHLAEVLPFMGLLWGATTMFGLKGAAIAWCMRCAVDALLMFHASRLSKKDLAPAALPLGLMVAALVASRLVIDQDLWLGLGATVLVGALSVGIAIVMAEDLRRLILEVISRFSRVVSTAKSAKAKADPS